MVSWITEPFFLVLRFVSRPSCVLLFTVMDIPMLNLLACDLTYTVHYEYDSWIALVKKMLSLRTCILTNSTTHYTNSTVKNCMLEILPSLKMCNHGIPQSSTLGSLVFSFDTVLCTCTVFCKHNHFKNWDDKGCSLSVHLESAAQLHKTGRFPDNVAL